MQVDRQWPNRSSEAWSIRHILSKGLKAVGGHRAGQKFGTVRLTQESLLCSQCGNPRLASSSLGDAPEDPDPGAQDISQLPLTGPKPSYLDTYGNTAGSIYQAKTR
jgi:hypothetical protein